ncbi:MAG: aminopeptidase P family protein [Balneolaceae bacterium]
MSAALHRNKLFGLFEENLNGVIYLRGAETRYRYDSDYEYPFRQESNFWYLSGVNEPGFHLLLDLKTKETWLFSPERDSRFAVWHGRIRSVEEIQELYEPDHLRREADLLSVLRELKPDTVYCLDEEQAEFLEDMDRAISVESETLPDAITWCRSVKTGWELHQLREAARVNNIAHLEVLKALGPGMYEFELKALFEYHQIRHGLLQDAYSGIHASGPNSAILHYVENRRQLREGELYLIDAGHEYNGYASDISRTWPVNGKYSPEQAEIYSIVLEALNRTIAAVQPGVRMEELHLLAARVLTEGLKDFGLLRGSVDDLIENDIFTLFFPHGIGHFLGLDTHDVGGYPKGVDEIERPGLRLLRVRRELHPGMVITVEPGIYFIPALLGPALEEKEKARFLSAEIVEGLFDFGGVRIEDNLILTDDGFENLVTVPRSIRDVEQIMK